MLSTELQEEKDKDDEEDAALASELFQDLKTAMEEQERHAAPQVPEVESPADMMVTDAVSMSPEHVPSSTAKTDSDEEESEDDDDDDEVSGEDSGASSHERDGDQDGKSDEDEDMGQTLREELADLEKRLAERRSRLRVLSTPSFVSGLKTWSPKCRTRWNSRRSRSRT